jgi:hypothetical protein
MSEVGRRGVAGGDGRKWTGSTDVVGKTADKRGPLDRETRERRPAREDANR